MLPRISCLGFIAACLCRIAYAGPDQWIEVQSAHFTVITDNGEKQGRHIAGQFERMRWLYQVLYPSVNVDPAEPIVVIAAKDQKVFDTMEPADYLAKGQLRVGGYYSHSLEKNYILLDLSARDEHPLAPVYHEYTHVQFEDSAAWLPLWLNEGLAEFMETTEIHDKDAVIGETNGNEILFLQQNALIPLDVLFKVDHTSPYYHEEQKGSIFYAESWALTHYLMMSDHDRHFSSINDYLGRLSHHEDPVTAAQEAFGDLKQLQIELESYIRKSTYKEFTLSSTAAPIDESTYTVRTLTPLEMDARRADVLTYADRGNEARTLLEAVLKEDANNVQAQETMGSLELHAGHPDEALKRYGDAVKQGSKNYLAYYYFAALSMDAPPGPDDQAIEDALRKAIELNPRFAPPYDRLAVFYSTRNEKLDDAYRMTVQAVKLDPSNIVFRQNAANVLVAMKRYDDAEKVLKAAEIMAKNPEQESSVQHQIEQVEKYRRQREEAQTSISGQRGDATNSTSVHEAVTVVAEKPKHPDAAKGAPKHIAVGVIHDVACSYPMVIEFNLEMASGKKLLLYNNDIQKIDLSTAGPKSEGNVNPCADFEGMKVELEYVDSPDKTVSGEVVAVMFRK